MSEPHVAKAYWVLQYECPICGGTHEVHEDDGVFAICGDEQFELQLPDTGDVYRDVDISFTSDFELDS